jgi:hypothetical protein
VQGWRSDPAILLRNIAGSFRAKSHVVRFAEGGS